MKKITTRNLVMIALLSGLSYLFFMWEIKIIDPLEFDFSDLFVMIAGYSMGVGPGILVAVIKNILHLMFKNSGLIGEVTNVVYALLIMIPVAIFKVDGWKEKLALYTTIVIFVSLSINVFNYFISMPIYGIPSPDRIPMIITVFIPFNIIKTSVLLLVFALIKPILDNMN